MFRKRIKERESQQMTKKSNKPSKLPQNSNMWKKNLTLQMLKTFKQIKMIKTETTTAMVVTMSECNTNSQFNHLMIYYLQIWHLTWTRYNKIVSLTPTSATSITIIIITTQIKKVPTICSRKKVRKLKQKTWLFLHQTN
jgi:hypothetical protein